MAQQKHACYVSDSEGRISNTLFFDIDDKGEVYFKPVSSNPPNNFHISMHKSGQKHIKYNDRITDLWRKKHDGKTTVEHSHRIYKSQLHTSGTRPTPKNAIQITMPDDMGAVHIMMLRLPKNEPLHLKQRLQGVSLIDEEIKVIDDEYNDAFIETNSINYNFKLVYRFYPVTKEEEKWLFTNKLKFIADFENIENLVGSDVFFHLDKPGDFIGVEFFEYTITKQDIEKYKGLLAEIEAE